MWTWNDKYLDYEIETWIRKDARFSGTTWNDKYLDYEIETFNNPQLCRFKLPVKLETTSTSITRLKL